MLGRRRRGVERGRTQVSRRLPSPLLSTQRSAGLNVKSVLHVFFSKFPFGSTHNLDLFGVGVEVGPREIDVTGERCPVHTNVAPAQDAGAPLDATTDARD